MHKPFEEVVVDISPIKTQRDYRNVLKEIEGLMIAKRDTPEGDAFCSIWSSPETGGILTKRTQFPFAKKLQRRSALTLPSCGRLPGATSSTPPPRQPVMTIDQLLRNLQRDRADR
jgi:hypothetical protein